MSSTMQKSVEEISEIFDLTDDYDNADKLIKTEQADKTPSSKSDLSGVQNQITKADSIDEEVKRLDKLSEELGIYNFTSYEAISGSNMATIHPRMQTIQTENTELGVKSIPSSSSSSSCTSSVDSTISDHRSVYVGSVEYSMTVKHLKQVFKSCGYINRAKIMTNFDGTSKGFAYIEFLAMESVESALALNGTYLNGRMITVLKKRTNRPGLSTTNRVPRGFRARQAACSCRGQGTRGYSERLHRGIGDSRYKSIRNPQALTGRRSFFTPY